MSAVLAAAVPGLMGILSDLFDGLSGKEKVRAEQAMRLLELARAEAEGQRQINASESAHRSIFVAGWRPAIGWTCAFAFASMFILRPILSWVCAVWFPTVPELPVIPEEYMLELTLGMLGMGGLRSFEKLRGVAR